MDTKTKLLLGAALSGILMSSACGTDSASPEGSGATDLGECHGVNSCKGQSACHTKEHSCSGQNSCKGKGWLEMTKAQCDEKGGAWAPISMQM